MKKLICLALTIALTFPTTLLAFAKETYGLQDDIFTQNYVIDIDEINVPLKSEFSLETMNEDAKIEKLMSEYSIERETAETLFFYLTNQDENYVIDEIKILKPDASSRSTRTYKGYGNKTYYEEVISTRGSSRSEEVGRGTVGKYFGKTLKVVVDFYIDTAINSVACGYWSLADSLMNEFNGVPSRTEIVHEARLYDTIYTKHTYVVDNDGQKYFGSMTQKDSGKFDETVVTPGIDGISATTTNRMDTVYTDNFNTPDKKAAVSYLSGGWTEKVYGYKYGNQFFEAAY